MPRLSLVARLAAAALFGAGAVAANAQVRITEWMYNGSEFIEFTNLGAAAVNMAGWSFDDDSRAVGTVSLSAFGTLAAGESAILSEAAAADFRSLWSLAPTVKVIGGNTTNLGRNDEINLYDAGGTLVDRLTYGDQNLPGTIRANGLSGNPASLAVLDGDTSAGWVLSVVGDAHGSVAAGGFVGNPGAFALAVPEPASAALLLGGLMGVGALARRRRG